MWSLDERDEKVEVGDFLMGRGHLRTRAWAEVRCSSQECRQSEQAEEEECALKRKSVMSKVLRNVYKNVQMM